MKITYQIDPVHSSAQFTIRHMMITNVRGSFSGVTGTIVYDAEHPEQSSVHAVVDTRTLNTLDEKRDAHVKSADFLDADQFPDMTYVSRQVEAADNGRWKVLGDLKLHGITREVDLDVELSADEGKDPWGNLRRGASAATKIKRSDFGVNFNSPLETGGVLLGDELRIELEISMVRSNAG